MAPTRRNAKYKGQSPRYPTKIMMVTNATARRHSRTAFDKAGRAITKACVFKFLGSIKGPASSPLTPQTSNGDLWAWGARFRYLKSEQEILLLVPDLKDGKPTREAAMYAPQKVDDSTLNELAEAFARAVL